MNDGYLGAHPVGVVGDVVSGLLVGGTLLGILPSIAAGLAIIWYLIQIFDRINNKRNRDGD